MSRARWPARPHLLETRLWSAAKGTCVTWTAPWSFLSKVQYYTDRMHHKYSLRSVFCTFLSKMLERNLLISALNSFIYSEKEQPCGLVITVLDCLHHSLLREIGHRLWNCLPRLLWMVSVGLSYTAVWSHSWHLMKQKLGRQWATKGRFWILFSHGPLPLRPLGGCQSWLTRAQRVKPPGNEGEAAIYTQSCCCPFVSLTFTFLPIAVFYSLYLITTHLYHSCIFLVIHLESKWELNKMCKVNYYFC